MAVDDRPEAGGDLVERLVPGDTTELPLPLPAGAPLGEEEPPRRTRVVEEAVHLGAEGAARERVPGVAAERDCLAVADGDDPTARVRAVESAN